MDFIDGLMVLRRRWWICLLGLVLVAAGVGVVRSVVPVQYQASGLMLFLLPADAPEGNVKVNPYLNLPSGLTTTASLIASEAVSDDVTKDLADEGYDAVYSVALVPDTGPLLTITATDTDADVAVATRNAAMDWVEARLVTIQDNVDAPSSQFMRTTRTSVTTTAEVLSGSRLRAMVGAAAGGLVLVLLFVFVLDRLLTRRQRATAWSQGQVAAAPPDPEPELEPDPELDPDPELEPEPEAAPDPEPASPAQDPIRRGRSGRTKKSARPKGPR